MAERVFVDTNVFVYADDESSIAKRDRARDIIKKLARAGRAVVSTQVLAEFFVVATRKLGIPADRVRSRIEALSQLDVVIVKPDLVLAAVDLHRLHAVSFWDALILRCASVAGCTRLISEDFSHGQIIDGVHIENPFLGQR